MNIAILGKFSSEEMGAHISDTLGRMGHQVYQFEYGPRLNQDRNNQHDIRMRLRIHGFNFAASYNQATRRYFLRPIINGILAVKDLDLVICTYDWLTHDEIQKLKQNGNIPIVLWYPDSVSNFGKAYFMTAGYDHIFFKDPYIVRTLREYYEYYNVHYLPEAFNPILHRPYAVSPNDRAEFDCDISIVGNMHSFRVPIIEKLLSEDKYRIKVYGGKPPFYLPISKKLSSSFTRKFAVNEVKSKAILCSKISLNTLLPGEIESMNARFFEINGIGGFQLTAYRKTIDNLFTVGKEVETYSSYSELIEKIDHYLDHENQRNDVAAKGRIRALQEHTYEVRLQRIIELLD